MTECQGCGAWNDDSRRLCVLCGTPLAATDEWEATADLPPLPPLPDGGLGGAMPAWLREPPAGNRPAVEPPPAAPPRGLPRAARFAALEPLGPTADPRTFLSDDDFPPWLRQLAAREAVPTGHDPAAQPQPAGAAGEARPAWPAWPALALAGADPVPPTADAIPLPPATIDAAPLPLEPAAAVDGRASAAPRAREERATREPWETLLLVLLFIGVVVAALWALVSNGVFSPAL